MIEYWTEERMKEKLNEAVARLGAEKQLTFVFGPQTSVDAAGITYGRLVQGVPTPEQEIGRGFTWIGPEVLKDFLKNFRKYLKNAGTVTWREFPHLRCIDYGSVKIWYIYTRLTAYNR